VDESTVRQAIREGRIAAAVAADGSVDAALADRLWAKNTTRAAPPEPGRSPSLSAARKRKLAASVALLEDEVAGLRAGSISPKDADKIVREELRPVAARLRRIARDAAPLVASKDHNATVAVLKAEVARALTDIIAVELAEPGEAPRPRSKAPTAVELDARKTDLLAERMEFQHALGRGEMVPVTDVVEALGERLTNVRSLLMALPGRLASSFAYADTKQARTILEAELAAVLGEL
jgi:hypothetical protein